MTERAKKRLFVAIDLTDEAREAAVDYIRQLRNDWPDTRIRIGWTKPQNLHLTLKFLGDVEGTRVTELGNAISAVAAEFPDFQIELSGTGAFPLVKKPKVLWLGVREGGSGLRQLAQRLDEKCEQFGFPRGERPFSPHLTIARVREPNSAKALAETHARNEFGPAEFAANQVVLCESTLYPNGPTYTSLNKAPLTKR